MRRLLSPRQLLQKKDHRSPRACVAAEPKTFSDLWFHCYSVIVYLQYIHYLVHFSSPLQDGLHFPDSWRKKMNNVENEAPIGLYLWQGQKAPTAEIEAPEAAEASNVLLPWWCPGDAASLSQKKQV